MLGNRNAHPLIRTVVTSGALKESPLQLVDIGCSGGIDNGWYDFQPSLRVVGYDPSVPEVQRLMSGNVFSNISYIEGFVKAPRGMELAGGPGINSGGFFERTTASSGARSLNQRRRGMSQEETQAQNQWQSTELSKNEINLEDDLRSRGMDSVDFIKIDVDGTDFDILRGYPSLLGSHSLLGVQVEVNLYGNGTAGANTFHNVDRFLRNCAFELMRIEPRTYSTPALPLPFELNIFAQSHGGRVFQADALYLKDPVATETHLDSAKTLKLACLLELFGMPDWSAELIQKYPEKLAIDKCSLLDVLMISAGLPNFTHAEYCDAFQANPERFYPREWSDQHTPTVEYWLADAFYWYRAGDFSHAEASCLASLRVSPNSVSAWLLLGSLMVRRGEWEGALSAFSQVLQCQPSNTRALGGAKVACRRLGLTTLASRLEKLVP